jgi:hypothetical protein
MLVRYQVRLSSDTGEILAHPTIRHVDGLKPVGKRSQVHEVQNAFSQGGDMGFAPVSIEKNMVRHKVGRQWTLH